MSHYAKSLNPNIKEIGLIKIRADLTNTGWKAIDKIIKRKSWFFEKVNKMDKPFARLAKKKKKIENLKITEVRN